MIYRHLITCGYLDAAVAMERECNVGLGQWELADNMDLAYVLQDFEEYFELKFAKKPVLVKKNPHGDDGIGAAGRRKPPAGGVLPRISSKGEAGSAAASGRKGGPARQNTGGPRGSSASESTQPHSTPQHSRKGDLGGLDEGFALQGQVVQP